MGRNTFVILVTSMAADFAAGTGRASRARGLWDDADGTGKLPIRKVTTPVPVQGDVAGGALPMSAGTSFHGRRKSKGSACHRRTMWPVQQAPQHRIRAMSRSKSCVKDAFRHEALLKLDQSVIIDAP